MLGCERDLVRLVPYQPAWAELYRQEAEHLRAALRDQAAQVEHVGSTAVLGLDAKPILDIVVAVSSIADPEPFEKALAPLGYVHKKENDRPSRLYFVKRTPEGKSTHHLNITRIGTECWLSHVEFRDYLRSHPEAREEYRRLKRELARKHKHDRAAYQEGKASFIERVLMAAGVGTQLTCEQSCGKQSPGCSQSGC